jgi:hypothetical protein
MKSKIRIFISYSHNDNKKVQKIINYFEKKLEGRKQLEVLYDKKLTAGNEFSEGLKNFITFSHVFVPIISGASLESGWVHQEIGYAMALNIPVLPISIEERDPGGMIDRLHAVFWNQANKKKEIFNLRLFQRLLDQKVNGKARFILAEHREERDRMIIDYAKQVLYLSTKSYGRVRNRGGLSVFAIPDKPIFHKIWKKFYGDQTTNMRIKQGRAERKIMERHALKEGFSLIINPEIKYTDRPKSAKKARLKTLLKFLKKVNKKNKKRKPDNQIKVRIAFDTTPSENEHLTIVGDYFLSQTLSAQAGSGLANTFFSRNALFVQSKALDFDEEMKIRLADLNIKPKESLKLALEIIPKFINNPKQKLKALL